MYCLANFVSFYTRIEAIEGNPNPILQLNGLSWKFSFILHKNRGDGGNPTAILQLNGLSCKFSFNLHKDRGDGGKS